MPLGQSGPCERVKRPARPPKPPDRTEGPAAARTPGMTKWVRGYWFYHTNHQRWVWVPGHWRC